MDPLTLLLYLVVAAAIVGIAWWAINQFSLPPPVRAIVVVVIALVCIVFLVQFLPGLGGHLRRC